MAASRLHPQQRDLVYRSLVAMVTAYALALGGTYNGILIPRLQYVSLAMLTIGATLAWISGWRHSQSQMTPPMIVPVLCWAAAYLVSGWANWSERVAIGGWYAGLYGLVWLALANLRQRGLPGRWLVDAALLTAIPLMILTVMQVLPWIVAWMMLDGVEVAFAPPRPPSALGNPNAWGTVLALLMPFGYVKASQAAQRAARVGWRLWLAAALACLYLTYSRGAWLAFAASVITYVAVNLVLARTSERRAGLALWGSRRRVLVLAGVTLVLLSVGVLLLIGARAAFDTPRREIGSRFEYLDVAWDTFRQHPGTGTGPFTFGLSLLRTRSFPPLQPHAHAHNVILNTAAELGILGLVALAVTVLLLVRQLFREVRRSPTAEERAFQVACMASLSALTAHSLVDMTIMMPSVMLLAIGIMAASIDPGPSARPRLHVKPVARRAVWGIVGLAWLAVLGTGWWSATVYDTYVRGLSLVSDGDYEQALEQLRTARDAQPSSALYHAQVGYTCGLAAARDGGEKWLDEGIAAYERALRLEPPHAIWQANLAALYWQRGDQDQAIAAMRRAAVLAPEAPDVWLNLGIMLEARGQAERAMYAYAQVLERGPLWGQARFWEETEIRRAVRAKGDIQPTPYQQALAVLQSSGFDAAIQVLNESKGYDPTQPRPYIDMARLALAYGDTAQARDYLDAARLLVHTDLGRAWAAVVEGEIALVEGEGEQAAAHFDHARAILWPPFAGQWLYLGGEVANFQYLRLTQEGSWLPQLTILGPDPVLSDLLRQS